MSIADKIKTFRVERSGDRAEKLRMLRETIEKLERDESVGFMVTIAVLNKESASGQSAEVHNCAGNIELEKMIAIWATVTMETFGQSKLLFKEYLEALQEMFMQRHGLK